MDKGWLIVVRLRDIGMLGWVKLLGVLYHSNWLSIGPDILDYLLLPYHLMNRLLIGYVMIGSLNFNGYLPSFDFRRT